MRTKLEVCVDDADGLAAAIAGGADRIELCSSLALGGLTPVPGLIRMAMNARVPVRAMIRPRAGDFVFSAGDEAVMIADIEAMEQAGLEGVVLGASRPDGRLDIKMLARLTTAAGALAKTLHRAIDLVPDPLEALEDAVRLGFDTILTSGCARTPHLGSDTIATLNARAAGRITIMAGGGLDSALASALVAETGVNWVHASGGEAHPETAAVVQFGFGPAERRRTSQAKIEALRRALD